MIFLPSRHTESLEEDIRDQVVREIEYDSAGKDINPADVVNDSARLQNWLEERGKWLPEEVFAVLEGRTLNPEEANKLAQLLERQLDSTRADRTCALIGSSSAAVRLRALARGVDLPEGEQYVDLQDSRHEVSWHGHDSWTRIRWFFTDGVSKFLGEAWPKEKVEDWFEDGKNAAQETAAEGLVDFDTLEPLDGWREVEPYASMDETRAQGAMTRARNQVLFDSQSAVLHPFRKLFSSDKERKIFSSLESQGVARRLRWLGVRLGSGKPSQRGDLWLASRHVWQADEFHGVGAMEYGARWNVAYTLYVLFAVAAVVATVVSGSLAALPLAVVCVLVPIVFFRVALARWPVWVAFVGSIGAFALLIAGRVFVAGDSAHVPAWLGGDDGSLMVLCMGTGVLIGLMPAYYGAWYSQALRNADKYGPFGCVWFRGGVSEETGDETYEFVLTDSAGQIVWVRRMSSRQADVFLRQFVYGFPDPGVSSFVGAEIDGWRQVFPALLVPREVVRDWREWRAVGKATSWMWASNRHYLTDLSPADYSWPRVLWRNLYLWRPNTLSEAMAIGVPGLTVESRDAYISEFGLDREPRGYEEALAGGKLVAWNAPW